MRVYELAKKLGIESRILIPELVRLGIEVTSHSNALDESSVQRAMEALQGKPLPTVGDDGKKRSRKSTGKHPGVVSRKEREQGASGNVKEEPKKPEKKHILIKRKKVEDLPPVELEDGDASQISGDLGDSLSPAPISVSKVEDEHQTQEDASIPSAVEPPVDLTPTPEASGEVKEESSLATQGIGQTEEALISEKSEKKDSPCQIRR